MIENLNQSKDDIYIILKNAQSLVTQGSEYMGYYKVRNHEIDIELPTTLKSSPDVISYSNARFNTWIGENRGEYTDNFVDIGKPLNEDNFIHTQLYGIQTIQNLKISS